MPSRMHVWQWVASSVNWLRMAEYGSRVSAAARRTSGHSSASGSSPPDQVWVFTKGVRRATLSFAALSISPTNTSASESSWYMLDVARPEAASTSNRVTVFPAQ